jgi:prepilin-type N-terminal cleavage/methylation domain-containing protein
MIKKDKAFTLVELLVVVAVLALLASIVFSNLTGAREQAKISNALSFQSNMHNLLGADLVGWWNFDQESGDRTMVRDSSGYGFNGDPSGTIEWREDSPSGKGYSVYLNGSRYINLYQPKLLDLQPQEDFTISLWFKAEEGVEGYFIAKRESGSANTQQFSVYIRDGRLTYAVGEAQSTSSSGLRFDNNVWHHFILTNYNDNGTQRYKVFIDGTAITPIGTSGTYTNEVDILIGARRNSSANTGSGLLFNGLIDDVRIYSRALTAYEVQTLYAQTKDNYLAEEQ